MADNATDVVRNVAHREADARARIAAAAEVQREMGSWTPPNAPVNDQEREGSTLGLVVAEGGKALWGGAVTGITETAIFLKDAASWVLPIDEVLFGHTDESKAEFNEDLRRNAAEIAPENETTAGNVARGVAQFLVPYAGWARGVSAVSNAGRMTNAFAAGFGADMSSFDPNDPNLSNLVQATGKSFDDLTDSEKSGLEGLLAEFPDLSNPINEFLATDPSDSEGLNRLRNGLEGLGLGAITEGLIGAVRGIRGRMWQRKVDDVRAEVKDDVLDFDAPEAPRTEEPNEPTRTDGADATAEPSGRPADAADDSQPAPPTVRETVRDTVKLTPEQRKALNEAVLNEDYSSAARLIDFNSEKFEWDSLADGDNLRQMFNTFSEVLAENIDHAKGGQQTFAHTQRLANSVGMSAEQSTRLFQDVTTDNGLAARMLASHRLLMAHGDRLRQLARTARETQSPKDVLEVQKAVELHAAIQAQVKGSQTEIARALSAMRQMRQAQAAAGDVFGEIDDILRITGGTSKGELGALLKAIETAKNVNELNVVVRTTAGKRLADALSELVLNGLLSLPKTQVLNIASNFAQVFLYSADRYIAGVARWATRRGDMSLLREANADFIKKMTSIRGAFQLSREVFREGLPITDPLQRVEVSTRAGINARAFGAVDESAIGRTINWLGRAIRIPGRFLLAGDEFFKHINVQGETAALAYREAVAQADKAGLTGARRDKAIARTMADLQANPTSEIQAGALHQARLATFQERGQTAVGPAFERALNSNVFLRLIVAPFFRTPMNIMRQGVMDRTVLGLASKHMREAISAGGEQRAIALARMTTGTSAVILGAEMVMSGGPDKPFEITGMRPLGSTERLDGAPDYGIRIGDNWYQYNRFDPVGTWLGMVADMSEIMKHNYDPDDPTSGPLIFELFRAASVSAYQNTISKSWFQSVDEILQLRDTVTSGRPGSVQRATSKFVGNQLFKLVPFSSAVRGAATVYERAVTGEDAQMRDVWTVWETVLKNFPGFNMDLPVSRDYLGRPRTRANSEWYMVNPFAVQPESDDPVDQALSELAYNIDPLPKSLENGAIPLNAEQYSEFKRLIGQERYGHRKSLEDMMREWATDGTLERFPTDQLRVEFLRGMWSKYKGLAEIELKRRYPELVDQEEVLMEFRLERRLGQDIDPINLN